MYQFAKSVVLLILKPTFRIEVLGKENIPKDRGVILCSNHINNLDPPVVGMSCPRPVYFMAKEELFHAPILKQLLPKINAFPVKRGMSDREALRKGLKILKDGQVLGLFPEGTRSKTGILGKGLAGSGFFAMRTDAAIVPCAVIGDYKFLRKVKVVFGKPIDFSPLRESKVSAEDATEEIMNGIQALLNEHK